VEVKFRLKNILSKRPAPAAGPAAGSASLGPVGPVEKALRILEFTRGPAAKEVLAELSRGDDEDRVVKAAREAVKRRGE
jgi:hypothetical protein